MSAPFGLEQCERLVSRSYLDAEISRVAAELNQFYAGDEYTVLSLLSGAIVFSGLLVPQLEGLVKQDYIHATRYNENFSGGNIVELKAKPARPVKGKRVLLLDDIFDRGHTLDWTVAWCKNQGAVDVKTAVMVNKQLDDNSDRANLNPDFVAVDVPDRYVFGMGMDAAGYYRNLSGIFAKKETECSQ